MARHCFVPPYLLREIARNRPEDAEWVLQMLAHDEQLRLQRAAVQAPVGRGSRLGRAHRPQRLDAAGRRGAHRR